jgi:hypothetical protein
LRHDNGCFFRNNFFQFVNANEVTAEQGLDVVHFDFVGGWVLKNQVVINQVKNPIFTSKVGLLSKCAPLTDSGT